MSKVQQGNVILHTLILVEPFRACNHCHQRQLLNLVRLGALIYANTLQEIFATYTPRMHNQYQMSLANPWAGSDDIQEHQ
jgi:hypothetical protein